MVWVIVDLGSPISWAASVKLRRSTTRMNARMASNRSISRPRLFVSAEQCRQMVPDYSLFTKSQVVVRTRHSWRINGGRNEQAGRKGRDRDRRVAGHRGG